MTNAFKNQQYFRNAATGDIYESYNGKPYQPEDTPISRAEGKAAEKEDAQAFLRTLLKPGTTVYTKVNHVSASGMSRAISLYVGGPKGSIIELDWHIARATSGTIDQKHGGIKMSGCGMDMGFAVVYNLGRTLWPKGTKKPHGTRNGAPDQDGGYALKQAWL